MNQQQNTEERKEHQIEVEKCYSDMKSEGSLPSSNSFSIKGSSAKGSSTILPAFGKDGLPKQQAVKALPQFLMNQINSSNKKDIAKLIKRMSSSGIFSFNS